MSDMLSLLLTFAVSLVLTLILEYSIASVFRMCARDLVLLLLANLLTNPAAVYLDMLCRMQFPDVSLFVRQIPIEIAVVAIEGVLYLRYSHSLRNPLLFAVVANAFSYGVGLLYQVII